jgi:pimeloyl-[acyl-carrier protein] methyl ester esterase
MTFMTLVLIPGLDGTGEFFQPFLEVYGRDHAHVIPLPQSGPQDYATLTEYVLQRLPTDRDYVLLAESFGGPIGANLALRSLPRLKGIIFVATFLSPPPRWATMLGLVLPLEAVTPTRAGGMILRYLFAEPQAPAQTVHWIQSVVASVPATTIKARIATLWNLRWQGGRTDIPALYVCATQDRLIPARKFAEFSEHFTDIKVFKIEGPHLILSARAKDCVAVIRRLFPGL